MPVVLQLLGIPLGYVYVTVLEWLIHRYIFHGLGKRWKPMGFHWYQHHRAVLKHGGTDPAYAGSAFAWNAHGREVWALVFGALVHLPLLPVAPLFYITAMLSGLNYSRVHRRSHLTPRGEKPTPPGTGITTWAATPTPTGA